ncbi:hypothetical protein AA0113_g4371 [Alternaria arborescens]|uniref:Uncharacterized protein n=2 Tax=Alternaria sect. Alternaria TaxID=2499237 RepID=A0A4Q4SH63_9PLEO|nr:hypothetical protein AA0112_g38 [Alternaria arborescens]RYN53304.1 hypothetical protein AA0114_g4571 [Alternaria tenuissima]RYO69333.1 hypothetical protein AA0113_g4371 [Alternaria arborescens]
MPEEFEESKSWAKSGGPKLLANIAPPDCPGTTLPRVSTQRIGWGVTRF